MKPEIESASNSYPLSIPVREYCVLDKEVTCSILEQLTSDGKIIRRSEKRFGRLV